MVHERDTGSDSDRLDGGGAGRVAWLGTLDRSEYRLRQRARIVLLAAEGTATPAITRMVGCTIGTASRWRVRYARKRRAGLDERGKRVEVALFAASAEGRSPATMTSIMRSTRSAANPSTRS